MKLAAAIFLASAVALVPASASATTVQVGPSVTGSSPEELTCSSGASCVTETLRQASLPDSSTLLAAPADGVITSWSVRGSGNLKLRVLHLIGEPAIAAGTSALATNGSGVPNATSLPIIANDSIGVDLQTGSGIQYRLGSANGVAWSPALVEGGAARLQDTAIEGAEFLFNATVTLKPVLTGVAPASGSTLGGDAVTVTGKYLDGATAVMFGLVPAPRFTIESPGQITAVAPAGAVSTVDVQVVGPGGTSAVSTADRYAYLVPPPTPATNLLSRPPSPGISPAVSGLGQTSSRWRRGNSRPKISRARAPVGTTFNFNLSKPATVRLVFSQQLSGRRVRGVCKAPNPSNARRRKCKRAVVGGTLTFAGHTGLNKVRFQGQLADGKKLKLGNYAAVLTARDAQGLQSVPRSLTFAIVG